MLGQTSGVPYNKTQKKCSYQCMSATLSFQGTAQYVVVSLLHFYLWGHLCTQLQFKMNRHFINTFLIPVKQYTTAM